MQNLALENTLETFIESKWDLLEKPCEAYLKGVFSKDKLIKVLNFAKEQCGSCGCEFDPLYDQALTLLSIN